MEKISLLSLEFNSDKAKQFLGLEQLRKIVEKYKICLRVLAIQKSNLILGNSTVETEPLLVLEGKIKTCVEAFIYFANLRDEHSDYIKNPNLRFYKTDKSTLRTQFFSTSQP